MNGTTRIITYLYRTPDSASCMMELWQEEAVLYCAFMILYAAEKPRKLSTFSMAYMDSFEDILLDLNSKAHDRYPVIDREELGSRRIVHSSAGIQQQLMLLDKRLPVVGFPWISKGMVDLLRENRVKPGSCHRSKSSRYEEGGMASHVVRRE